MAVIQKSEKKNGRTRRKQDYQIQLADICRQRLLGYAESFEELARSFSESEEANETGEINESVDHTKMDREAILDKRRVWEGRQVFCEHLGEVARIMSQVAGEELCILPVDDKRKKRISKALREEGILVEDICSIPDENGHRRLGLTLRTDKKGGKSAEEVADLLAVLLHKQFWLSAASPIRIDETEKVFFFMEEATYVVLTGFAKAVKENEDISGDNYSFLELEKGRMTALLSDGTGSGEKAGRDSERVLDLMEKLLEAGFSMKSAVKTVNSAWFARNEDSNHPTLDICDFDLYEGNCEICKVGGATTFLKRGNQVEQIAFRNLPLGIFRSIDLPKEQIQLQNGDYLVMMTDGVPDAFGQYEDGIAEAIGEMEECNPGEMAEKLIHLALCAGEGHVKDDMTVLVAGIWENVREA